jgi:hypothetical protein
LDSEDSEKHYENHEFDNNDPMKKAIQHSIIMSTRLSKEIQKDLLESSNQIKMKENLDLTVDVNIVTRRSNAGEKRRSSVKGGSSSPRKSSTKETPKSPRKSSTKETPISGISPNI